MKVKRFRAGEYEVKTNGRTFQLFQECAVNEDHDGDTTWSLHEIFENGRTPEYCNHFARKWMAIEAIKHIANA